MTLRLLKPTNFSEHQDKWQQGCQGRCWGEQWCHPFHWQRVTSAHSLSLNTMSTDQEIIDFKKSKNIKTTFFHEIHSRIYVAILIITHLINMFGSMKPLLLRHWELTRFLFWLLLWFTEFSELTLVEPEVCPPLHGHEVPEPLVRRLMVDHDGHPLLARLRGVGRVHQDAALPDNKDI